MSFSKRHPYLFWQLIGWGALVADFGIFFLGSLLEAGEWLYPLTVFTFIFALAEVVISPFAVKFHRMSRPDNVEDSDYIRRSLCLRIANIRRGVPKTLGLVLAVFTSILIPILAAYFVGEHINIFLGIVCLALAAAVPIIFIFAYNSHVFKDFYKIPNADRKVTFVKPDIKTLYEGGALAYFCRTPLEPVLDFFYNWLSVYLADGKLTVSVIPIQELCRDFNAPAELLEYADCLVCFSYDDFHINDEKRFHTECNALGIIPFNALITPKTV